MKSVFPSKILLAGEYTVLLQSDALAIPYHFFSGGWRAGIRSEYPFDFEEWVNHLSKLTRDGIDLDVERMRTDYINDIRFVSNVPQGGGLGSSGAVTAAFFNRYMYSELSVEDELDEVRTILSEMESYFHGHSSGVDPLVSLTGKSYAIVENQGRLREMRIPDSMSLHLILTTTERNTAPLISFFLESMEKKKFADRIHEEQIPAVSKFVSSWIEGRVSDVEEAFSTISRIEWDLFKPMVTKEIRSLWKQSLESDRFSIKLCGAGGGGAYLACGELPEDIGLRTHRIGESEDG